ncbi:MAG: beta-galactosidase, partial [Anaerolineales bacterium]|nr:beta-galactosidase [Anaerolineales bacterium]
MKSVTISDFKVWVEDNAISLIGGEVHYWRLAPENWRKILERVQELNLEVVSTYVCWDFHECAPGEYD